jgi:hypothetical protein
MGEAKNNPRSPQYTGPLPDFAIQPLLGWRMAPTSEWKEANKEAIEAGTAQPPTHAECDLEIVACAVMAYPSRLVDPREWKQAAADVGVVARIPFTKFKALIDAQLGTGAPTVAAAEETPATVALT